MNVKMAIVNIPNVVLENARFMKINKIIANPLIEGQVNVDIFLILPPQLKTSNRS
jgi:hypothetical protein